MNRSSSPRFSRTSGRLRLAVVLSLILPALAVATQASEPPGKQAAGEKNAKPAWEWTVEERLATRFDPIQMRQRVEANAAPEALRHLPPNHDYLVGFDHPELFLPVEVFQMFTERAFSMDRVSREITRGAYE